MSLKIHAFPLSPRSFKVLLAANHLGLDYELVFCDFAKGMQKSEAYTAININQRAPALEDGDFKLWESNAIIHYLATRKPGLLPMDEQGRADVLRWQFWESTTWDPACATLVFERVVKQMFRGLGPDPAEVEKGLEKFKAAASILNAHLKGRAYVAGDKLSIADLGLASALTMAVPAQLPLDAYPEIQRWSAAIAELPAWKQTLAMQTPPAAAA